VATMTVLAIMVENPKLKMPEKPRTITHLLDDLGFCLKNGWVNDRLGGYELTMLDRGRARKVIQQWLKESTNKSRV
jgi:hypothetical protein